MYYDNNEERYNLIQCAPEKEEKKEKKEKKKKKPEKKKECKPWQQCWLKEHPYDPYTDVHNIYYNFNNKCTTALDSDCDGKTPGYSAPPPAGF